MLLVFLVNKIGVQVVTGISNKGEDFFWYKRRRTNNFLPARLSGLIIFQQEKGAFSSSNIDFTKITLLVQLHAEISHFLILFGFDKQ